MLFKTEIRFDSNSKFESALYKYLQAFGPKKQALRDFLHRAIATAIDNSNLITIEKRLVRISGALSNLERPRPLAQEQKSPDLEEKLFTLLSQISAKLNAPEVVLGSPKEEDKDLAELPLKTPKVPDAMVESLEGVLSKLKSQSFG